MTPLHDIERVWFNRELRWKLRELKFGSFQDFFADVMEARFGTLFSRICPWGSIGDMKCDGFLVDPTTVFQVYAPQSMSAKAATNKIQEDFAGALEHWKGQFTRWVFVHNSPDMSALIRQKLNALGVEHPDIKFEAWSLAALRDLVFELPREKLVLLLGPPPSARDWTLPGFEEIQEVLSNVSRLPPADDGEIAPVLSGKEKANGFLRSRLWLRVGRPHSRHVGEYFRQHPDAEYEGRMVAAFRKQYAALKEEVSFADEIYDELTTFAAGSERRGGGFELAVHGVLAYFFDKCVIFEPAEEVSA